MTLILLHSVPMAQELHVKTAHVLHDAPEEIAPGQCLGIGVEINLALMLSGAQFRRSSDVPSALTRTLSSALAETATLEMHVEHAPQDTIKREIEDVFSVLNQQALIPASFYRRF